MSERRWTMRCECGRDVCRRIVGDFVDLPAELQWRYLQLGVVQSFIVLEHWSALTGAAPRKEPAPTR